MKDNKVEELIEDVVANNADVASWIPWIENFKDNIYPKVFAPMGVSLDFALLIYQNNEIKNKLSRIREALEDDFDSNV